MIRPDMVSADAQLTITVPAFFAGFFFYYLCSCYNK